MMEIELGKGGACLYRDNGERIDPDKDFSHIDKRIQDVLGHYQKDFMGEVSADNLGARWGGYGSFLPVSRCSPISTLTRTQTHMSSRSPHNPTTEVRQNPTIQANGFVPIRQRRSIPTVSGQATSALDNAVNVRSSGDASFKNQPKAVPADLSDNNFLKQGSDNVVDNSAIYSGLGLDMSPSSSFEGSPADLDGTSPCKQRLPENSPSYIIKVMTSLPFPGGQLLSPLSESFISLMEKEINLERNLPQLETSVKTEHESVSSEGKMTFVKERRVERINKNKLSEVEKKYCEDPISIVDHPSKKSGGSMMSKGKEIITEKPQSTNYMHFDKKGASTFMEKDTIFGTSFPINERNEVAQLVEVGSKFQKRSHVKQEPSLEQVGSLVSPVGSFEEKGILTGLSEKIQKAMNVRSVVKTETGDDMLSQTGYINKNSKKSKESKKKLKEELHDSFSTQDLTQENAENSGKQQRKMKNKVKVLPDSTFQKAGIDRSMEKIHYDGKPSSTVEKDFDGKKKHKNEEFDNFQGMKYLDGAKAESLEESSSAKSLTQSQMGVKLNNRKERLSSEGKKKIRKSQEGSQSSAVLPKVSFKVGSAAHSQQTDSGSVFVSQGEAQKEMKKVNIMSSDVASNAALKKKEKITATKYQVTGVAKREKYALGSQLKDQSEFSQYQYPSIAGLNPRTDLTGNTSLMEKVPTSGAVPTENAPVLIQEDWVQCDKCQTWRLLPHNIKPDDLPKRWLCSMLTWLPGMNKCSFTEDQTRDALRALYQLPPAVNDAQIHQTRPSGGRPVVAAADKQPAGITMPATGLDAVPTVKRGPKQEIQVKSKLDQLRTAESGNKQKPNQPRSGADKEVVVIGKKRESSNTYGAVKKVKRDSQQFGKDQDRGVAVVTEIGSGSLNYNPFSSQVSKDLAIEKSNISAKKLKDKAQPAVTKEEERNEVSAKKRKPREWNNGTLRTEVPSSEALFKERGNDLRKEKKPKLKESNLHEKESSTTRPNDKNDGDNQEHVSCGGSSQRTGRREYRLHNNTSRKTVDGKLLSRVDPELRMPALAAATSSSSKVSSTGRVKVKSKAKCSPVGSISSSPMEVSRSDHDRSIDQISGSNIKQEVSMPKRKNLEARFVAPKVTHHYEERTEGKSKQETDAEVRFHPAQEDVVVKEISAVKHVDRKDNFSHRKFVSADQCPRSFCVMGSDKPNSDNMLPERVKCKQDQAGSSRDDPSSSTQVMDFEKIMEFDVVAAHDSKGKNPNQPGCGKLVGNDVGASGSVRKDNPDRAARTALKEAKDLKHSANRLKISGSGLSTEVFFQAALKFLNGASLLEFGNTEGSGCGDVKPSDVYRSTAKLCFYCAHEFEKLNDMASAALAYKCMEVAYMRVVYDNDVAASRDRQELQLAQTEVHQDSPSSSASDVDNVNNPTPNSVTVKGTQSAAAHANYVIPAGNQPSFVRLLNFAEDVNLAMDAARKSQNAFAVACLTLRALGNEEGISAIKRVLDFSFHDVDELLYLVRLAIEAIPNR